jgi:putative SOS response-associated peptidase YedK
MCGRFVLAVDPNQLALEFNLIGDTNVPPNYNVAPTQPVAIISNESPSHLTFARWGLMPSWAKDLSMSAKMINARSETVDEKPAFRAAFKRRRCLIPASGFYEWQTRDDGKKYPMYIHPSDAEMFGFAGLWEVWHSPEGDELRTCTILTTAANDFMKTIHERMPVILPREQYADWLAPGDVPAGALKPLLRGYDPARMTAHEVSKVVNRAGFSSPDMIAAVQAPPRLL